MGYQQTVLLMQAIVVSTLLASALAIAGQYVPRSYYVIDKFGHQSDFVYLRTRRALDLHPFVMRSKRGGGSYSSSSASSSSSAGAGAGDPIYFGDNPPNRAYSNVESNASGNGGGYAGGSVSFASSSSSSSSGTGGGGGGGSGRHPGGSYGNSYNNNDGPQLFSRFGEAEGTGVKVGASAAGPKAAFSSSSSSIDSDGKIKYSIQSGKI
ncbi:PREDICTED: keratin, type I cytoskeletal 10-like [Nicrophorus vespilloides]|uniref:Keratin, type I cytoskeletal 10-like n=1 Tax=Nicrophorus vespilloides TaxID=110193 RepID=A0ABM1NGS6_NICVS|nr:PREDICTED: keratin, type I cytoskeletal 10-like [Nicrophorus vespilloides]